MLPPENIYGHTKKLRYILARLDALRDALGRAPRVLDFGCGNGEAISQFLIEQGNDYTGVDFHAPSLEHAAARFGGESARFLPCAPDDGPYDALVYSDVLEHLDHPVEVLREHRPLIADGGWLIGSVPNGYGPFEMEKRVGKYTGLGWVLSKTHARLRKVKHKLRGTDPDAGGALPYNAACGHVQFYTKRSITQTLADGGFVVDDFRKGCFMGSSASAFVLRGRPVMTANNAVGDVMPSWAVSTWYFTAKPTAPGNLETARGDDQGEAGAA